MRKFSYFLLLLVFVTTTACNLKTKRSEVAKKPGTKAEQVTAKGRDEEAAQEELEMRPEVSRPKGQSVGLILGPGGMKTFAHLGVLKEFEKAKIPVRAVVGLEMGALMGAFYSATGSANEAEWKLFKLKEEDLAEKSLFQSKDKMSSVNNLLEFTKKELGAKNISEFKVSFSCMSLSMRDEKVYILDNGNAVNALKNCLPYPPLFKPSGDRLAAVNYVKQAADFLKNNGMDVVVLVNVISAGKFMSDEQANEQPVLANLWIQTRKSLLESEPLVDYTITIDTKNMGLNGFEYRRALIQTGGNDGRQQVSIFANKFGF